MLKEQLSNDLKVAMKEKNIDKKNTITLLRAAIKQVEVDERKDLSDEDIHPIIQKEIRLREKALVDFEKAQRTDLTEQAKREIEILRAYLPAQLSEAEIITIVEETRREVGNEMGPLMKALKARLNGRADMALVNKIVRNHSN